MIWWDVITPPERLQDQKETFVAIVQIAGGIYLNFGTTVFYWKYLLRPRSWRATVTTFTNLTGILNLNGWLWLGVYNSMERSVPAVTRRLLGELRC